MHCILSTTLSQAINFIANIMDAQIEGHLPLITHRITFAPKAFGPLPVTARMEFPAITVSHRDFTPPLSLDPGPDTGSRRGATPRREKTPSGQQGRENSVMFDDDIRHLSPLTDNSEDDGVQSEKIMKPRGGSGRPGGKGYNLQTELGWNDRTYESVVVSEVKAHHEY